MYFLASVTISGLMMGAPLAFGFDVSAPPTNLTGWLVFIISLCGAIGIMNAFFVRYILRPAIQNELKASLSTLTTRAEFIAHDKKDTEFQDRVERYIDNRGPHLQDRY